jgi:hypothetical protein
MKNRSIRTQVASGLRLAGLVVFFIATAGIFAGGVVVVTFPRTVEANSPFGGHPMLGWVFLIVSTIIMLAEAHRWCSALPGVLGYATLGGALSVVTGHVLANPRSPIPRLDALIVTLFYLAAARLSRTFKGRKPNLLDRLCAWAFAFALIWQAQYAGILSPRGGPPRHLGVIDVGAMAFALLCLIIPWIYARRSGDREQDHRLAAAP